MKPSPKLKTRPNRKHLSFEAIGTWWEIDYEGGTVGIPGRIANRIEAFDKTYSRFRRDSWVAQLAGQAGTYTMPEDGKELLKTYRKLYRATNGELTPLIGQLMADAGYDANYSLRPGKVSRPSAWEDILEVKGNKITIKRPVVLDFGAAGKGYLADLLGGLLGECGVKKFTIDAGGDILHKAKKEPLRVGLEHPGDPGMVIGVAEIGDGSICASAGNRRAWEGYHHIISPSRLASPDTIKAVWVTANTALLADGLATALFFTNPGVLQRHFAFEYVIMYTDGSVRYSPNLKIELY